MSNQELREQFARCQKWEDPEQWELLALAFAVAGFPLNAGECFRRADALRAPYFAKYGVALRFEE
jgi:hypothetical protein